LLLNQSLLSSEDNVLCFKKQHIPKYRDNEPSDAPIRNNPCWVCYSIV